MVIKESRVFAYRTPDTYRDIEDWRKEPAEQRQGLWAVHCLRHDERTFFPTYQRAKDCAALPEACPICDAFDRRCVYCPTDTERWLADQTTGFTASVGHVRGNAVCLHHRYGDIPEGIEYEEKRDEASDKTAVEVFVEQTEARSNLVTVMFQPEQQIYGLLCQFASTYLTPERAAICSRAFNFSLSIAASLNAAAKRESDSASFGYFETWEEMAVRNARNNNVNSMG